MSYGNSAAEEFCDWKEEWPDCMDNLLLVGRIPISSMEGCLASGNVPEFILSQAGLAAILMLMLLLELANVPLLPQQAILPPRLCIALQALLSICCASETALWPPALTIRTATVRRKRALSMRMSTPAASMPARLAVPAGSRKYRQAVAVTATVNMLNTCKHGHPLYFSLTSSELQPI